MKRPRSEAVAAVVLIERTRKGRAGWKEGWEEATVPKMALPRAEPNLGEWVPASLPHGIYILLRYYKVKCFILLQESFIP